MVIRYVVVAIFLAYLTNVYVKRKNNITDIKGRVLEWRVDTYKSIHRWAMQFQSVTAAPSQDEERYKNILALTKFKIGYQGMEYSTFFDSPDRLFQFGIEFNRLLNKEENFIDHSLRHQLSEFQYWLDDVIMYYGAFCQTECDANWQFDEKKIERHCNLVCKVLGISLQKDVNKFYDKLDNLLRDRLRNLKISGVYMESWWTRTKSKATDYCEAVMDIDEDTRHSRFIEWLYYKVFYHNYSCSQLMKNQFGMMTVFMHVHFEEQFAENPSLMKNQEEFMRLTREYYNCYNKHLKR